MGRKVVISTVGETAEAYVPPPLPPKPPVNLTEMYAKIDQANLAVGRLDGVAPILPGTPLFCIRTFERKQSCRLRLKACSRLFRISCFMK